MPSSGFTIEDLRTAILRASAAADAAAEELNAQDAKMGDGDLGITVSSGYREIEREAAAMPDDLGQALVLCAKAFQRVSASSYGTLTATGFLAAAKHAKGRVQIPWSEVGALVALARDAMRARGKGELGDKSVLDMLDSVASAIHGLDDPVVLRLAARRAATDILERFREQPCKLGRARTYGAASIGIDDPGMLALMRIIDAL